MAKHDKIKSFIAEIDSLASAGKSVEARRKLQLLKGKRIPRLAALPAAVVASRLRQWDSVLRFLNPIVRPSYRSGTKASDKESALYAGALIRIGAVPEAVRILETLDAKKHPEVLLYRASAHIVQWNYEDSIPLLEQYVRSPVDDYQRLIGQINLAAGLVHERQASSAKALLKRLEQETTERGLSVQFGNVLELGAQLAVDQEEWSQAARLLQKAEQTLKGAGGVDALFVDKWKALSHLRRTKGSKAAIEDIKAVRKRAMELSHWETVRDCDLQLATVTQNEALLIHVYFGTPFPSFQKRIYLEFGRPVRIPPVYPWAIPNFSAKGPEVSLLIEHGQASSLKQGQLLHRTLGALTLDFYRPVRIPTLFSVIYPQEHFNPVHSPGRIHQALRSLRNHFTEHRVPLQVGEQESSYQLSAQIPCRLLVPPREQWEDRTFSLLSFQSLDKGNGFSAEEACRASARPRRSVFRLLQKGVEEGKLRRTGAGPSVRYLFNR